ncbi:T-lymphoma invasion and metastasis-inducing protein 1 [Oryzias melastigma]|uniref:T-lymphoma invasion and metastasis-inducing protein 1 n=1 Tax=Oryzias melastigma TaxID=30732 RepID=A0A834F3Z8_ORYME|nr:T-lymphoma invasion and metastasis-inducing protein 1 [Oryzias melastigma]
MALKYGTGCGTGRLLVLGMSTSTEQGTPFSRSLHDMNSLERPMSSSSSSSSSSLSPSPVSVLPPTAGTATQRQLSHADKLRKVISELVETEKTYVKDLRFLIERYRKPLQKEHFLTQDELDVLFGNLGEMEKLQVEFLRTLEDGIRLVPDLDRLERVDEFKKVLFSLGGSFLYYADRFKIYSAFCASHTKVPKVLAKAKTDPDFKAFLAERNPKQQHSSTLESYLIKPIQRVLKYPLLLKELYSHTDPDSEEHYHLDGTRLSFVIVLLIRFHPTNSKLIPSVAMKAMNKVASHINEMQKLHEEYGAVFDQLINEQSVHKKEVPDLSMGDLLLHSTLVWMNPPVNLMKSKKDTELAAFGEKNKLKYLNIHCKHLLPIMRCEGGTHRASVVDDRDPFRFRYMIATDSLQVRGHANSEATAVCEIVHVKSESEGRPERIFQLCCSSPDSKKDFLKAVHSILREKQRRQLLKSESLPPNQQCAVVREQSSFSSISDVESQKGSDEQDNRGLRPDRSRQQQHQPQKPHREDTDRWLEEQFNLGSYEEQCESTEEKVKETDILSDDDEYCKSVRSDSADGLKAGMEELDLQDENPKKSESEVDRTNDRVDFGSVDSLSPVRLAPLKHCVVGGATNKDRDMIWVRRDEFTCNGDVF